MFRFGGKHRGAIALRCFAVSICAAALLGCGGGSDKTRNEKMSKVAGVVTLNGKPLDAGMVSFSNPYNGFSGSGEIMLAGKFEITLIPVGDYRVAVLPPAPKEAVDPASVPKPVDDIPAKYRNAQTSGLQATVTADGPLDLKFELTK
jgi:hypothetical protein